jgi:hypothetical protein
MLEEVAQAAGPKEFRAMWDKKAPSTMAVPEVPSNFLPDAEGSTDSKVHGDLFPVNFVTPHSILSEAAQVRACLPGARGAARNTHCHYQ